MIIMSDCAICTSTSSFKLGGKSKLLSNITLTLSGNVDIKGRGKLSTNKIDQLSFINSKIRGLGKIRPKAQLSVYLDALNTDNNGKIVKSYTKLSGNLRTKAQSKSKFSNKYTDKIGGHVSKINQFKNFSNTQKLFPIKDQVISLNNSYFVNESLSSGNLYDSVNEGLFTGNYNENLNISRRISDDDLSYIQPSSIYTSGTFRYKCEVSTPYYHPEQSFLFLRASAPLFNYGSRIAPQYKIHNIKFEDPSGNLIVKYKDITLKGDADYTISPVINYSTYVSEPEINNANLNTWHINYPILHEGSGYTLSLDFDVLCLDDPFSIGFGAGYEDKLCNLSEPTQGYYLNPTNTIRISTIEICNSGDLGIKKDNKFNFYTEVSPIGQRLSKSISPVQVLMNTADINIYPNIQSTWKSSPDSENNVSYNTSVSGCEVLTSKINDYSQNTFISLFSHNNDSGRLTLKFSHSKPEPTARLVDGAFDFSFVGNNNFDKANLQSVADVDNFFVVDSIELRIIAKKAVGSRDYALDVVGYSDDKILNVTPKIGAFLQNKLNPTYIADEFDNLLVSENNEYIIADVDQYGDAPKTSGFKPVNDLGISSQSLSDKDQYYYDYLTSVDAGDHYRLSTLPVIDSTSFKEYIVPLEIYEDRVSVGKSTDYSMSSYFENLYIDLYPIPSGASISSAKLVVYYRPSNGMALHTFARPSHKELGLKDITLLPTEWNDIKLNNYVTEAPLSVISGIPQSYSEELTLKTNYARRWRGVDGNVTNGPYDPNQFDFSFYNPQQDHPFLYGFFDFNNISGNYIFSRDYSTSGYISDTSIIKNIGSRFNSNSLYSNPTSYRTIDWTVPGNALYGKITDAYDNAFKTFTQTTNNYILFDNLNLSSGFAIYTRFTPTNSFIPTITRPIFALRNIPQNKLLLQCSISENNSFVFRARNANDTLITESGGSYRNFQYPLSLLLIYDKNPNGILRLYARNELDNSVDLLCSTNISLINLSGALTFGSASIVTNPQVWLHEIGFSTSGNIVDSNPNKLLKQTTAQSFLDSHSHGFNDSSRNKFKLHSYVDDSTSSWNLGDFKSCSFSVAFNGFTTRIGSDYLVHHLKHSGSGYAQITNLPLPSNVFASGLAYHTQIENDFLRFNLQDIPDANFSFYSASPRISKNIPRGYSFKDNALSVETVIEYNNNNNIIWPDNKTGPKLIVSLYSKNKNPVDRPSKVNWGLVNRSVHYLDPSGCYEKISSTFNYNDLIDTSEPWANFDLDNIQSEFDQKFYSDDIDDMFLQYDIAYPSGSPFESSIKIHSVNVKLKDALTYWADINNNINLYSSGEAIRYSDINLITKGLSYSYSDPSGLSLYTIGEVWPSSSASFSLNIFGVFGLPNNKFNLFVKNSGFVGRPINFGDAPELFGSEPEVYPEVICYVSGGDPRREENMNLVMIDNYYDHYLYDSLPLYLSNKIPEYKDATLSISIPNPVSLPDFRRLETLGLVSYNDQTLVYSNNISVNLFTQNEIIPSPYNDSFNLYVLNTFKNNQPDENGVISWNKNNLGKSINAILDADVPYLEANDEIRGVDLICYGDCDSSNSCEEKPVVLHDITWYENNELCVDGGIFRPKNVYTNPNVSGFKTANGYDNHFYGIRKYDGLVANAPYSIKVKTKSGSPNSIQLPSRFTEIDYGSNEYVNYSGIKLVNDDERQPNNKYGKSVAVKYDLMAVGSPMQPVSYSEYNGSNLVTTTLNEAGAVYLYRRNPRPSGFDWPQNEHKSDWILEEKLSLPSGFLKDYPTIKRTNRIGDIVLPDSVSLRYWNVGQEGRQFGHSVDIGINKQIKSFQEDQREIVVVGGPSAKWARDFEDLNASGVSIGLLVFTDEFSPTITDYSRDKIFGELKTYQNVLDAIAGKDLLFRYFCDPPVKFDVKVIICEPIANNSNYISPDFEEPKPNFIVKKVIPRNQGIVNEDDAQAVFSGIKAAFEEAFPYDISKLNNNIPVMMGVYVDNSRSLGRSSVSPGLDRFIEYYKQYSFASGVRDFYNVQSSGSVYEYYSDFAESEDWIGLSQVALNGLLDTGRLFTSNEIRYFASGVGPQFFNSDLSQFNYPPASGGRVYIFEKESGCWNLIQEIISPVNSNTIDRFGHAVAISEDTNVIAVGSPYMNECCKIYEFKPEEKDRLLYSLPIWLPYKSSSVGGTSVRYLQLIDDYNDWVNNYGTDKANQILYSELTPTEKFEARQYFNINEYQNVYTYKYSDIPYVGTWAFIPKAFAPTSRLGYSVAVNDNGNTVAFGAPTDSFNAFDDFNVYYKNDGYADANTTSSITPSWRSNVNAGAVRLFESRNYYPHNSVVEFGKFGNLQESLNNPEDSGHFNYIATIFEDKNFRKMSEGEVSIPQDAGLAFIITPGEDALSDEVVDNIISWLSLGDRNLVLVGNDPIWEENGLYNNSNNILNRLLEKLDSNLRLYPARSQTESLPSGKSVVIPSFRPSNGSSTYINALPLRTASGVADIRMHIPGYAKFMPPCPNESDRKNGTPNVNYRCEMPLIHQGDLRAQWNEWCLVPYPPYIKVFPVNWPYVYGTYLVSDCVAGGNAGPGALESDIGPNIKNPGKDPIPLLVAAQTKTITKVYPAIPQISTIVPVYKPIYGGTATVFVDEEASQTPSFIWDHAHPSGYSVYESNVNNAINNTQWYTPDPVEDRFGLIQAKATTDSRPAVGSQFITDIAQFCVQQDFNTNDSSKIIAIAGTESESQATLYGSKSDRNINFYVNMVSKNATGNALIAQLGGWTGRTSFNSANVNGSLLRQIFINTGNDVTENVTNLEVFNNQSRFDVCWIANPLNIPTSSQIDELKSWLNTGNKKLIITHDSSVPQVLIVDKILELLGTNIKSLYLPVKEIYPTFGATFSIDPLHFIANGFNIQSYKITTFQGYFSFISFAKHPNVLPVGYVNLNPYLYDDKLINIDYFRINSGIDKVTFPAVPNSGYKIFVSWVSEFISENTPIDLYFNNVSTNPKINQDGGSSSVITIKEFETDTPYTFKFGYFDNIGLSPELNKVFTKSFNVQNNNQSDKIEIYINTLIPRIEGVDYIPKTPRLIGISGVMVPIREVPTNNEIVGSEFDYDREIILQAGSPERIVTYNVDGAIASLSDRYCTDKVCIENELDKELIEDGPVVAAQETSFVAPFNAGVARSRITIISDSNLVQGRYMVDEFGRMSSETVGFIRSLYPETSFPSDNFGRQYTEFTKIVAPERGSPQKYLAVNDVSGIKSRFGPTSSNKTLSVFSDKESTYDPKYVKRTMETWTNFPENVKEQLLKEYIAEFIDEQKEFGATTLFSGVIDGKHYIDAGIVGGMPKIMQDTGSDYLDFDRFPSGYPGDLFGFSLSLHDNKLVVGSPFSAFSDEVVHPWSYHVSNNGQSGIKFSNNGGAGAVYVYEKTFKGIGVNNTIVPWEFVQKLRPSSINVGQDLSNSLTSQDYYNLGPNSYTNNYLQQFSTVTDQFGYDVSIDSDVIVVGAPGHDFDRYSNNVYNSGGFIRKSFNPEFDIPSRLVIDLGSSGVRNFIASGQTVLNHGAVFAFENSINNWFDRSKKWKLIEKISSPEPSRQQSFNENDNFGRSVYVHRSLRSDSDYVIVAGSENHDYSSSGTNVLNNTGAVYSNDIVLREFPPATPNQNSYIDIKVFGERLSSGEPYVRIITSNSVLNKEFETSGIIYSDKFGAIFLEASGQDKSNNGFVQHRPYVISIEGLYYNGENISDNVPFYIGGRNADLSGVADLFTIGSTGNVYNNLGLYTNSIVDFGSGVLNFYTDCPDPTIIASNLNLMVSGIGTPTDKLNLRIRGY